MPKIRFTKQDLDRAALHNVALRDIADAHGEAPPWKSAAPVMTESEYALIVGQEEQESDLPPEQ